MKRKTIISAFAILMSGMIAISATTSSSTNTTQKGMHRPPTPNVNEWVCADGTVPTLKEMKKPPEMKGEGRKDSDTSKGRPPMPPEFNRNNYSGENASQDRPPKPPEFNSSDRPQQDGRQEGRGGVPPELTCTDGSTPTKKTSASK